MSIALNTPKKFRLPATLTLTVTLTLSAPLQPAAAQVSFELPNESFTLKKSPGVEQVQASCLLCHSTDYISTQPPLNKAQWTATVEKMRTRYGAPIPTNNIAPLVEYLTLNYGKSTPAK